VNDVCTPTNSTDAALSRRILIVDDNHDAADLLSEVFTMHGHVTSVAYGGVEGLAVLADFDPDVVFLDIGMPDMDGCQVARRMRAMAAIRQPLLVAYTAWNDEAAKTRVHNAGFDLHVTKTARFDCLLDVVNKSHPHTS
jgi:CheY-like chemotaxis protein